MAIVMAQTPIPARDDVGVMRLFKRGDRNGAPDGAAQPRQIGVREVGPRVHPPRGIYRRWSFWWLRPPLSLSVDGK
jgi:hypothetical protein